MFRNISFFQKNMLLLIVFTVFIGITLITSSFFFEGKVIHQTLTEQGEGLGSSLANSLDVETVRQSTTNADEASDIQKQMTSLLDKATLDNGNIAQAYLIHSQRNQNGKYHLISTPTHIKEVFTAGAEIEDYPGNALEKAMTAKKATATELYSDDIGTWFTVLTPILDKNGEIIAIYAIDMSADIIKNSQWTMVKYLALALVVLLTIIFIIQYFNLKRILAPINQLSRAVYEVASGNLNIQLEVKNHDEVGVVVSGFNEMVEKIRTSMYDLETASQQLSATFSQVSKVSEDTTLQAKDVLISLEEITSSTEHLAHEAESGNSQLLEINERIEDILRYTKQASHSTNDCLTQSHEGIDVVESLKERSLETEQITLKVGQKIYDLEGRMRRINDLLSRIQDVAEQTSLLSLNASIEAARAGEHGRGFSVVADEIRKLSTNSKQASEEIATLLKAISQDVGATGQEMRAAENSLRLQSSHIENTIQSFYRIRNQIQAVHDHILNVDHTIQVVDQSKENLLTTVESVSSMSEQTAASVEMIQRNFSDQLKSIKNLNESCQILEKEASELSKRTNQTH